MVNTKRMFFDTRWNGQHGIGRFSSELALRLKGFDLLGSNNHPVSLRGFAELAKFLHSEKPDVFVTPGYNVSPQKSEKQVCTIHDLIHLRIPGESSRTKSLYYRTILLRHLRRSRLVFTVSQFSKNEICDWAGLAQDKVVVVHNGISSAFSPNGGQDDQAASNSTVLYVGNSKPHKNVDSLLVAFGKIAKSADSFLTLVTGSTPELREKVRRTGVPHRVTILENVTDDELAKLYRSVRCLVIPSCYEGFGLPAAEAMASGCPVLCSNATSLPEIVGNAGTYFEPHDVKALTELLEAFCLGNVDTGQKILNGLDTAEEYCWDQAAKKIEKEVAARFN